jgi:hypothetical protein
MGDDFPEIALGPDMVLRSGTKELTPADMFSLYGSLLCDFTELQERMIKTQQKAIEAYDKYIKLRQEISPL